jgi:hypothetical protein
MSTKRSIKVLTRNQSSGQPTAPNDRPVDRVGRDSVAVEPDQTTALDLPELWGHGSFPASDPPANW